MKIKYDNAWHKKYYQDHLAETKRNYELKKQEKDETGFEKLYGRFPSAKELAQYIENKQTTFTPKLKGNGSRWYKKI